ncbi:hypothetical protein JST97_09370 [bacterium]|nr:hypothetical protein [bacterium]
MRPNRALLAGATFGLVLSLIITRGAGILLMTGVSAALAYLLALIVQEP